MKYLLLLLLFQPNFSDDLTMEISFNMGDL